MTDAVMIELGSLLISSNAVPTLRLQVTTQLVLIQVSLILIMNTPCRYQNKPSGHNYILVITYMQQMKVILIFVCHTHMNGRVSSMIYWGCRGEASLPNPPTSPPKVLSIIYSVCVSIIIALMIKFWLYNFCASVKNGHMGRQKLCMLCTQSIFIIFPPNKKS